MACRRHLHARAHHGGPSARSSRPADQPAHKRTTGRLRAGHDGQPPPFAHRGLLARVLGPARPRQRVGGRRERNSQPRPACRPGRALQLRKSVVRIPARARRVLRRDFSSTRRTPRDERRTYPASHRASSPATTKRPPEPPAKPPPAESATPGSSSKAPTNNYAPRFYTTSEPPERRSTGR